MKLSTRTRYGIRAILEQASHYNQGPLQINVIAKRQAGGLMNYKSFFHHPASEAR